MIGDSEDDLEFCRTIADVTRERGHYAFLAPSAASQPGRVLAIYPENKPDRIQIHLAAPRLQLNHGPNPLIDELGQLRRPVPE